MKRIILCWRLITAGILTVALSSCDPWFSYSPFETRLTGSHNNLTAQNLASIDQRNSGEVQAFKIAVISDIHYHHGSLDDAIADINRRGDFSFLVVVGDLTDNGLKQEFIFFERSMSNLKIPYITVIGNHDYLANGEKVYEPMFGSYNYSFVFNNVKFVLFDNNTIESGKDPDFDWLEAQLNDSRSYERVIPFAHVPPYDVQMKDHIERYHALMIAHNIPYSIHGHRHTFSIEEVFGDGIQYVTVSSPQYRAYSEVSISASGIEITKVEY